MGQAGRDKRKPAVDQATRVAGEASMARAAATVKETMEHNRRIDAANQTIRDGTNAMEKVARQYQNTGIDRASARVLEEKHVLDYNLDSTLKGEPYRATTTRHGAPYDADITNLSTGKVEAQVEFKSCATPARTAKAAADPQYNGKQLVTPADQTEAARAEMKRQAARNRTSRPAVSEQFEDASSRTSDRIHHGGAESKPVSRAEIKNTTRKAQRDGLEPDLLPKTSTFSQAAREIATGSAKAGAMGAVITGVASGTANVMAVWRGDKGGKEAVLDTAADTVAGAADTAAKVATGSLIKAASTSALEAAAVQGVGGQVVRSLAKGNVALMAGVVAVDTAKDLVDLTKGLKSGSEVLGNVVENTATTYAGFEGAAAGAAIGTAILPGVGTVVGGLIGGMASALGVKSVFRAIRGGW